MMLALDSENDKTKLLKVQLRTKKNRNKNHETIIKNHGTF